MMKKNVITNSNGEVLVELTGKDGKPYYGDNLDLCGTSITSLPEGLTVGGSLDLRGTSITSIPEGLTVSSFLDLEGCTSITSLPDGLTVGGFLDLRGTSITSLPGGLTVGGDLYLRGTSITSLSEGLTVGDFLDLRGTSITSLPEGLTVGGDLDLRGTSITDHSKVRRQLSSEQRSKINNARNKPITWAWNGRKYIKVDGEFTVLDSQRGNVYHTHYLGKSDTVYLITDGEGHWAHGAKLQEARQDLLYKINDRDTSAYKNMSLDDEITFEEAVAAYRTITGACAAGTRNFVKNRLPKPIKDKYTIREMLTLTRGEYGSEKLQAFFGYEHT